MLRTGPWYMGPAPCFSCWMWPIKGCRVALALHRHPALLRPSKPHGARGWLGILYCDNVWARFTPSAQVLPLPDGLLQSSPSGCRMPVVTQVGRTSWGWVNFEVGAAIGHIAHSFQTQCSGFLLLGHKNVGAKNATEIEEKLYCCHLPTNSYIFKTVL